MPARARGESVRGGGARELVPLAAGSLLQSQCRPGDPAGCQAVSSSLQMPLCHP